MDLNSLYQFAERNQINVMSFHTPHKKAYCMNGDGIQIIIMDYSKIVSEREEKEILAEEVAHLQNKYLYFLTDYSTPNFASNVRKCEAKAQRKAAEMLIPLQELKEALYRTSEIWELAEIFDTSETTVRIALEHYRRKNLI